MSNFTSFRHQILLDPFLVLCTSLDWKWVSYTLMIGIRERERSTGTERVNDIYISNKMFDRSVEQRERITAVPLAMIVTKVAIHQMTSNSRDGERNVVRRGRESIHEIVVLDPRSAGLPLHWALIASALLHNSSARNSLCTYRIELAAREDLSNALRDGWLLGDAKVFDHDSSAPGGGRAVFAAVTVS